MTRRGLPLGDLVDVLLWLAGAVGFYFLPTIVGRVRMVPNLGSIAVINLFLGWTLVGWVVALATRSSSRRSSAYCWAGQMN